VVIHVFFCLINDSYHYSFEHKSWGFIYSPIIQIFVVWLLTFWYFIFCVFLCWDWLIWSQFVGWRFSHLKSFGWIILYVLAWVGSSRVDVPFLTTGLEV
jgi:hypothetical protein